MTETTMIPTDDETCAPDPSHAIAVDVATTLAGTLKALADPLRLRMLSAISTDPRGESCVCDLAELADVSQPTVSHHLKVLKTVGLLESQRRGTWVWYSIAAGRQAAVSALLEGFAPAVIAPNPQPEAPVAVSAFDVEAHINHLITDLSATSAGVSPETVTGIVRDSYTGLARSAKITRYLVPLTERFAKQRLADITRDTASAPPQVLFICVANAGRSQLAAALTRQLSGGRVIARSAGSTPAAGLNSNVAELISDIDGENVEELFPKPLTDDAIRAADVVITMGCGDVCPIVPGLRYEDWSVADPALASPEGVALIRDDLATRVQALLDSLTN
ncbi:MULTISPECIES: metalloregulator ArsR/SmtB family transcription factor [Brevibacterium]|uniref:ArsR family transcriptional regulator n=1 Tax=Brevibacterium antiquum CNRZ 918 TaxID=1255637 RepID=A0A2H1L051_9MICO|nr:MULTISPECIES: metalloregulator ArsR/SmtB family transcription factor [Brevibacterium]SMY05308.1 ArsR family transcriptional regulator [Brevibacterium antiquum CNRZ 918]HCG57182.1 ArsR family transcriptional regulator [Brevibacterium sp.]